MSRLSRDDWAVAALEAIAAGGVAAVSVEPMAARLGATKGSFYWHFKARGELVDAALRLWEQRSTLDVIHEIEATGAAPEARLRQLFSRAFDAHALTGVDVALSSHFDDPQVRDALERVTERRIGYVARLLRQSGLSPRIARRRAVFVYSAFLGNLQLMRSTPDPVRSNVGSLSGYADEVIATLLDEA